MLTRLAADAGGIRKTVQFDVQSANPPMAIALSLKTGILACPAGRLYG
jgi:hypothetical protein